MKNSLTYSNRECTMTPKEEQSAIEKGMEIQRMIDTVALRTLLKKGHAPDTTLLLLAEFKRTEEYTRQQYFDGCDICSRM